MRGSSCPDGLLATHPTAICLSFDDAAVPAGAGTCQCACTACMRRCDGEGPLLFYPGTDGAIAPMLYVGVSLAAGKRIGVYVRARGVTASAGVVQALGFAPLAGASPQPLAANGPQVYEETVIAPDLSKPAPDGIVLLGTSASALMVDCIVPFYEP